MNRTPLHALRERASVWWSARSGRERVILRVWGTAAMILLLWLAVVSPLNARIAQLERRVPELESRLNSMRAPPRNAARVQGAIHASSAADLRSTLFRLLADKKINGELRAISATRIELRLPELPMSEALALLEFLRQESGARIAVLNAKTDGAPSPTARVVVELERAS